MRQTCYRRIDLFTFSVSFWDCSGRRVSSSLANLGLLDPTNFVSGNNRNQVQRYRFTCQYFLACFFLVVSKWRHVFRLLSSYLFSCWDLVPVSLSLEDLTFTSYTNCVNLLCCISEEPLFVVKAFVIFVVQNFYITSSILIGFLSPKVNPLLENMIAVI